ncbi:serine hydrolase domain-containing protein [Stakelama marina]|uniref:Serine hydrolase n=1 Tax=Stakelama marina TaxID=2826939 RepID=A0A8T4IJE8_9SPHN|nr:serine hydrolase [Stakelama marina]MBR0554004.1 serine hydrolase [Stakelama marina]
MSRKHLAWLAPIAAMFLVAADAPKPAVPEPFRTGACPDAPVAGALPPLKSLFTDHPETRAELLLIDGCTAVKAYEPGYSDANRLISWSMAKTVTAMLVGELVSDGKLQLDAPAPVAEWQKPGDPRAKITLRNLLNMASGLRHTEIGNPIEKSDTNQVLFVSGTQDMAARAIGQPLEYAPGTHFEYSSLTTIILSEIITRTLTDSTDPRVRAKAYRDFAQERLFGPAGVKSAFLEFDGAGTQIGGSLIYMTLPDWGRMGSVLLDGKAPDGTQIVDPAWLAFMKTPSKAYAGYGGQTWLNTRTPEGVEPGLFDRKGPASAAGMKGHLGQFVFVGHGTGRDGKEHDVVLVRLGHTDEGKLGSVIATLGDAMDAILPAGDQ